MNQEDREVTFKGLFLPLTTKKAIIFIFLIGFVVFFNMLSNGLVLDDNAQIIRNFNIRSLSLIPNLFVGQQVGLEPMDYYRPLPFVFYALIYSVSGLNTLPYHLAQLLFHIGSSVLIFLIFKKFLRQGLAFFLALLFLVHPMNQEVAAYVADLQDTLFLFFGLASFYLIQKSSRAAFYVILANICLLFSLFSKETGVIFFVITFLYVILFKKRKLLLHSILSVFSILVYMILRFVSQVPIQKVTSLPMSELSFAERIVHLPAIIFFYIKSFIFPQDLSVYNTWVIHRIGFDNFVLPLLVDGICFFVIFLLLKYIFRKNTSDKKIVSFFVIWLVLGILVHSQIILLDATVANRFFYFPMVGLLAIIGLFIQSIAINPKTKMTLVLLGVLALIIFSVRTIARNNDWKSQSSLLAIDERTSSNEYLLELLYGNELIKNNQPDIAKAHIQKALAIYSHSYNAWSSMGVIYTEKGDIKQAKEAFLHSISLNKLNVEAYENLGLLIKTHETPLNALNFLRKATKIIPISWKLWYYRFIVEYKLGNSDEALLSAKNYYLFKRDETSYALYLHLLQKLPVEIK
jgi:protein O-mannosyl-transferase